MEYLDSINDKLTTINEQNIIYYNIYDYPELIYGNINLASHNLNFSKLPKSLLNNIENNEYLKDIENLSHSSYGTRLRFHTDAKKIIFKIELKQKYHYNTISNENSSQLYIEVLQLKKNLNSLKLKINLLKTEKVKKELEIQSKEKKIENYLDSGEKDNINGLVDLNSISNLKREYLN